uniref:Uncharacterized protein n=1 Tax=Arundo donax TaxID=35708 RepID=A0A0A9D3W5_ARUDO
MFNWQMPSLSMDCASWQVASSSTCSYRGHHRVEDIWPTMLVGS